MKRIKDYVEHARISARNFFLFAWIANIAGGGHQEASAADSHAADHAGGHHGAESGVDSSHIIDSSGGGDHSSAAF